MMNARLYTEQEMKSGELHTLSAGQVAVYSNKCPGSERVNQDAAAVVDIGGERVVLIVADGMGGARAGEKASGLAVEILSKKIRAVSSGNLDSLRSVILDGIEAANEAILQLGVGAGTTLAVAEIHGTAVRPYHIGDSVILTMGQRGKVKFQTLSHSPVGYAIESGYIDEKEALHHDARHIVSNMLGSPEMRIDVGVPIELAKHDTVLLCSDGLFDNLSVTEIVDLSRKGPLQTGIQQLIELCEKRMSSDSNGSQPSKPDDLTVIAFRPRS